ncbi:glycosyltransferase [Agromyces sp. SYSU K20354]|uniref:glycosyltransferase n=1 Tax=Agromyces cavernae TaxID=2898659 RepID=UPI001E5E4D18|nr:glycosyltransferase [Agromyces cavernae]MCD2444037.1 glycosyltransferase [Agromyces cavernae]
MRNIHRVLVFPAWQDNPYLNMMSLAPRASGYEFKGVTTFDSLSNASRLLGASDVLHVHWTDPIVQRAASVSEANDRLSRFVELLDGLRDRGGRLIWTVHNRFPHEVLYRDVEVALYRLLAERADAIHIMSPDTPAMLADTCDLPADRTVRIPHPSYLGVYGVPPSRADARRELGLDEDVPTALFFGQMRPYKGLQTLIDAVRRIADSGRAAPALLLAGSATAEAKEEISAAVGSDLKMVTHFGFVPDSDLGKWFAAADIAVFPYRAILNSGSLHLAAAFRTPVILPGEPHLVRQYDDEHWVQFFDPSNSVDSMVRLLSEPPRSIDASQFDAFNERNSPWKITRAYAGLLDRLSSATVLEH